MFFNIFLILGTGIKFKLLKNFITVGGMTFISRILGLLRDVVIARFFGASILTDAFFVAFRLPNLLRRFFAEGAFSQAFVPVLSDYKLNDSPKKTQILINQVSTLLFFVLVLVCIFAILAAPIVIFVTAPGFASDLQQYDLTVTLFRICFPYILFVSLTALAGGILNVWGKFAAPAVSPALLNLSIILFGIWLAPRMEEPILALSWGVLVGGILQLGLQVPYLVKLKIFPRFSWDPKNPGVKKIFRLMVPTIFGASVSQISLLINTIFASFLISGSISWLYYADRLMELPVGLLGAALGTTLLPRLAKSYALNKDCEYARVLDSGIRLAIVLAAPCAVGIAILGQPILATLFFYGEFTLYDLRMTSKALLAYSVGILALVLSRVLTTGFYGKQNTKTPVKIALITLLSTQVLNLMLIWRLGHIGLALAIAISSWINVLLLGFKLIQTNILVLAPGWLWFNVRTTIAVLLMAGTILLCKPDLSFWIDSNIATRILSLCLLITMGILIYFSSLWIFGMRIRHFGIFSSNNSPKTL